MLLFHHLAREGASPETIPEAERRRGRCRRTGIRPFGPGPGNRERLARRPRTGLVTPRSGGPGLAVRWHYDRLPSMAGRDGDEGWRKLPGSGVPKALRVSCPEAWRPGTEKPQVERREAPSPDRKGEGHASQACRAVLAEPLKGSRKPLRFSALRSPLVRRSPQGEGGSCGGQGNDGLPGADQEYGRWRAPALIPPLQGEDNKGARPACPHCHNSCTGR